MDYSHINKGYTFISVYMGGCILLSVSLFPFREGLRIYPFRWGKERACTCAKRDRDARVCGCVRVRGSISVRVRACVREGAMGESWVAYWIDGPSQFYIIYL